MSDQRRTGYGCLGNAYCRTRPTLEAIMEFKDGTTLTWPVCQKHAKPYSFSHLRGDFSRPVRFAPINPS
jgi:hypothetical protein